jgi:hypothetical protein
MTTGSSVDPVILQFRRERGFLTAKKPSLLLRTSNAAIVQIELR